MKVIEYLFYLTSCEKDRLRVKAYKHKNKILGFVVQYEAKIQNKWEVIVRYDTSHGFAHKDIIHADGKIDKEPFIWQDYNVALTYATEDLKRNWEKYRNNYEKEVKGEQKKKK